MKFIQHFLPRWEGGRVQIGTDFTSSGWFERCQICIFTFECIVVQKAYFTTTLPSAVYRDTDTCIMYAHVWKRIVFMRFLL